MLRKNIFLELRLYCRLGSGEFIAGKIFSWIILFQMVLYVVVLGHEEGLPVSPNLVQSTIPLKAPYELNKAGRSRDIHKLV